MDGLFFFTGNKSCLLKLFWSAAAIHGNNRAFLKNKLRYFLQTLKIFKVITCKAEERVDGEVRLSGESARGCIGIFAPIALGLEIWRAKYLSGDDGEIHWKTSVVNGSGPGYYNQNDLLQKSSKTVAILVGIYLEMLVLTLIEY